MSALTGGLGSAVSGGIGGLLHGGADAAAKAATAGVPGAAASAAGKALSPELLAKMTKVPGLSLPIPSSTGLNVPINEGLPLGAANGQMLPIGPEPDWLSPALNPVAATAAKAAPSMMGNIGGYIAAHPLTSAAIAAGAVGGLTQGKSKKKPADEPVPEHFPGGPGPQYGYSTMTSGNMSPQDYLTYGQSGGTHPSEFQFFGPNTTWETSGGWKPILKEEGTGNVIGGHPTTSNGFHSGMSLAEFMQYVRDRILHGDSSTPAGMAGGGLVSNNIVANAPPPQRPAANARAPGRTLAERAAVAMQRQAPIHPMVRPRPAPKGMRRGGPVKKAISMGKRNPMLKGNPMGRPMGPGGGQVKGGPKGTDKVQAITTQSKTPIRLDENEYVFSAKAVKNAGGAKVMDAVHQRLLKVKNAQSQRGSVSAH